MATIQFCLILFMNLLLYVMLSEAETDYYTLLGVSRSASMKAIKKAYRRLARNLHPDKNQDDPNASAKFQELGEAHDVLTDSEKKAMYDKCGKECINRPNPMGSFTDFFDFDFNFNRESQQQYETPKGSTINMDLFVTLEELYKGHFIEITRSKSMPKITKGTRKCNCRQEFVTRNLGNGKFQMMQQSVCSECPNVILVNEQRVLEIEIESGMADEQQTVLTNEGEPHLDREPGDLIFKIKTLPHPVFERRGDDLYTNVTISLQEALIGLKMTIKHLDGHLVTIQRDKIIKPGAQMRKKGEGMPNYKDNNLFGNLYITFDIAFPDTEFPDESKEVIAKLLEQNPINRVYNGLRGK